MREVYRILDANFNRAREALRVIEDFARFGLDDAHLSTRAKDMRSRLQVLAGKLPARDLLASRDSPADVGREARTATERVRADAPAVVTAAFKRLAEALRSLAEFGKTISAPLAEDFEKLRYEAYTFEQRMARRLAGREAFGQVHLYVLLTAALCRSDPLAVARAAIQGGADCIQLREKQMPDGKLLELARRLRELTAEAQVLLIVNDRPDVAAAAGADGVHVGQDDLPPAAVRRVLPRGIVGLSTHDPAQLQAALDEPIDYLAVGPMFPTATKDAGRVAGPELLERALAASSLPVVAIGGIDADNVAELASAGAKCVAVCSAVIAAPDPAAAAARIKARLTAR